MHKATLIPVDTKLSLKVPKTEAAIESCSKKEVFYTCGQKFMV